MYKMHRRMFYWPIVYPHAFNVLAQLCTSMLLMYLHRTKPLQVYRAGHVVLERYVGGQAKLANSSSKND